MLGLLLIVSVRSDPISGEWPSSIRLVKSGCGIERLAGGQFVVCSSQLAACDEHPTSETETETETETESESESEFESKCNTRSHFSPPPICLFRPQVQLCSREGLRLGLGLGHTTILPASIVTKAPSVLEA